MKTERRHELQTNELAQSLNKAIERLKPYSSQLTIGVIVAAVLIVAVVFYLRHAEATAAEAWDEYFEVKQRGGAALMPGGDPGATTGAEGFRAIADDFSGTAMADWANLAAADALLRRGAEQLTSDRKEALSLLNSAETFYDRLKSRARVDEIRQRATFSLARTYELRSRLDEAVKEYRAVEGVLADVAKEKAQQLETDEDLRAFYDWYAKAERSQPPAGAGTPGEKPAFDPSDPEQSPLGDLSSQLKEAPFAAGDRGLPAPAKPQPKQTPEEGAPPEPPAE